MGCGCVMLRFSSTDCHDCARQGIVAKVKIRNISLVLFIFGIILEMTLQS